MQSRGRFFGLTGENCVWDRRSSQCLRDLRTLETIRSSGSSHDQRCKNFNLSGNCANYLVQNTKITLPKQCTLAGYGKAARKGMFLSLHLEFTAGKIPRTGQVVPTRQEKC